MLLTDGSNSINRKRSRSNFFVIYRMALIKNVADMQRSGFAIVSMLGANLKV
jgi:hypothetical protein